MKPFSSAKSAFADISDASKKVGSAAEWQTIALATVAVVSVVALMLATAALVTQEPRP